MSDRLPVPLDRASRLLNHGPTVLVSARSGGRQNVMAAAWAMALDFVPPKVAVVIDKATYTRELIESSNRFALSVPCVDQARLVTWLGTHSGRQDDKFAAERARLIDEPAALSPLVEGCVAWLDCERMPEPHNESRYDLFIGEVTGAWADPRVYDKGRWRFHEADAGLRTLHHVAGGHYLAIGESVDGTLPGSESLG